MRERGGGYTGSMSCSYVERARGKSERRVAYVSRRFDRTTHDNDLFDPQERLRVFCSGDSKVSQGSNCYDGDSVRFILRQNLQHDLMSWLQRWDEQRVLVFDRFQGSHFFGSEVLWSWQKEGLPCFFW
jgi:hypothetical protein